MEVSVLAVSATLKVDALPSRPGIFHSGASLTNGLVHIFWLGTVRVLKDREDCIFD